MEIATEAFRRMGYAAQFEPIDWEQKTDLVESGTIDCIWGCFSMDGREQLYRWAGPYMTSRQVVAVNADSGIETLADLAGKTMMVQSTTKPEEIFLAGTDPRIPQLGTKTIYNFRFFRISDRYLIEISNLTILVHITILNITCTIFSKLHRRISHFIVVNK